MNDFARLGVGILLLGLAIYLSLNFDSASPDIDANPISETTPAVPTNKTTLEKSLWQAESTINPGQAENISPPPNRDSITTSLTSSELSSEIDSPNFQTSSYKKVFKQVQGSIEPDRNRFSQPPKIADQYRANSSLNIDVNRRPVRMTPIRPKPAFAHHRPIVQKMHTIRDGDTLQSIAREYFGTADRYLEIYMLNRDVLSNLQARLPKDEQLKIPGN